MNPSEQERWQPHLRNEWVILRPLREDDREDLLEVASDPLIWEQHPAKERCTPSGFHTFFDESIRSGGAMLILDSATRKVIGSSRYQIRPEWVEMVEIGWTFLSRQYWGGTYNHAAKRLMIAHAFNYVVEVVLFIDCTNIRSQKAAIKIGAVETSNDALLALSGKSQDTLIYKLFKDSWGVAKGV